MKQAWEKLARRINQLSLRERGIIFIMIMVIVVAFFNLALLDPLSAKENTLSQKSLQMRGEIQLLQTETLVLIKAWADNPDPNVSLQSRLMAIKKQLNKMNVLLQGKQQQFISPLEIPQVLKAILLQNNKLQLVSLSNFPTKPLIDSILTDETQLADQSGSSVQVQPDAELQIFKHGVEIVVEGEYFDLLAYLDKLEKMPLQMFWDRVSLDANEYPYAVLTLTVYTLSLDKTWLKV